MEQAHDKLISTSYTNSGANASYSNLYYRGYYYDTDLKLYYLNSRYYDPNTGRFVNIDGALYHSMLGYNMYAYCNNNPVNYSDPTGESATAAFSWWIATVGTTAAAEPTPFGEIVLGVGIIVIGCIYYDEVLPVTKQVSSDTKKEEANDSDKDDRLHGTPGEVKEEGDKETHIGSDGKADRERHHTDHGHPKYHTNPHDHDIIWDSDGNPNFSSPHNYWDGNIPIFP